MTITGFVTLNAGSNDFMLGASGAVAGFFATKLFQAITAALVS